MHKLTVETKEGDVWRQTSIQLKYSRRGNNWFSLDGRTYVFADFQEDCPVLVKTKEGWTKAGRVARGSVFLGEGQSYSETCEKNCAIDLADGKWKRPVFA